MTPLLNNKRRKLVESNHVPASDMMESVLQEIGLGYVADKFKDTITAYYY